MKVLWICGLPNEVRLKGWQTHLSERPTPAWSWILGHLPPPKNVELHIVCPVVGLIAKRMDFDYLGAHWHCFKRKSFRHVLAYLWHCYAVRRFVKSLMPNVVHGWGGETGLGYLATRVAKRAVVSVQGLLMLLYKASPRLFKIEMGGAYGRFMIWREKRTYECAAKLLTESDFSRAALLEYYGRNSEMIPHPLRKAFLANVVSERRAAAPQFVFVGSFVARKGALDIVNAFAACRHSEAKLVMIGDGVELDKVKESILSNGLEGRVELKSSCSQEEIAAIMRQSCFFSLPTYGDTGPTALKEAIACGLFPICYDNSGPHEYITRYCGYLVPTGDVAAYTAAMDEAIDHRGDCISKALDAAGKIHNDLAREVVWGKLVSAYKEIL